MAEESTEDLPSVEELMQRIAENYEALPRQLKNVATYI
jgi:DNA-binding MurR/RpiR family transcriptional regulator